MKTIILIPKIKIIKSIDLQKISDLCKIKLEKNLIAKIVINFDYRNSMLSDLFDIKIKVNNSAIRKVIIKKSNHYFKNLGKNWSNGVLKACGDVGSFAGSEMSGGEMHISGSCLNNLGSKMQGGKIFISGSTGDYVGSSLFGEKNGMNGGLIYIKKNAGDYLGNNMRRGIIYVDGNIGHYGCSNIVAGTVIISGRFGDYFCLGMKRGTVIIQNDLQYFDNNLCFEDCGIQEINFFSLFKKELTERTFLDSFSKMTFRKIVGDRTNSGLGEILVIKKQSLT